MLCLQKAERKVRAEKSVALLAVLALGLLVGATALAAGGAEEMRLGFDDAAQWAQWREVGFPGKKATGYSFDPAGRTVCARADGSASGMIHPFPGSLAQHPVLSWEWRIEGVLKNGDAHRKQGDDYPARVYVNFEGDQRLSWWERARVRLLEIFYGREIPGSSLIFIWANRVAPGAILPNPYTDRARMIALQSGEEKAGQWIREQVAIPEWYRRAFGTDPPPVHSIAIMTDADDTGETAAACYRNIRLLR